MKIRIYQVSLERDGISGSDSGGMAFCSYEHNMKKGTLKYSYGYNKVYEGEVETDSLEELYGIFNIDIPDDFYGRSLSVSDVVEIIESDSCEPGFYYCDTVGFKQISFNPSETVDATKQTITVVLVEPGKEARTVEIGRTLGQYQKVVDGNIEAYYPFADEDVCCICNEEGKVNGMKPNRAIYDDDGCLADIIFGQFFICSCSAPEFGSLTEAQIKRYTDRFRYPEQFYVKGGKICSIQYLQETEDKTLCGSK